jgi:hypothetical protein
MGLFGSYWSTEGAVPGFEVFFIHVVDLRVFSAEEVFASNETRSGYRKRAIVAINTDGGPSIGAAWMVNVVLRYRIGNTVRTLRHNNIGVPPDQ